MTEDRYRDWDAAYVLGALPSDERLEYERHLETCAACREAVAELAGLPGILGRLPVEDAIALDAPAADPTVDPAGAAGSVRSPRSLQEVAHRVGRRRRRRRVLTGLVAAVAVVLAVVGGIAIGGRVAPTEQQAGVEHVMEPVTTPALLTADIRVAGKAWGTRFDWSCDYGEGGWRPGSTASYDLVVTRTNGTETTVATWSASGEYAKGLAATTGIPEAQIRSVDIRLHGRSTPLVETKL